MAVTIVTYQEVRVSYGVTIEKLMELQKQDPDLKPYRSYLKKFKNGTVKQRYILNPGDWYYVTERIEQTVPREFAS